MRLFGTRHNAAFSKHPRSSRARLARCILPALALSAVFSVGTLAVRRQAPCTGRAPSDARPPQTAAAPRAQPAGTKRPAAYDILLCGTDADGVRTDTIILAHLDCARHRAALLSLPRDTPIRAEGGGLQKLNAVYAGGGAEGMQALCRAVRRLVGIRPDGYVLIDLTAFCRAVDALGGVEFDVPMDMDYDDPAQDLSIHLKKGRARLTGSEAMGLVRFRSGYATQDIRRTQVQQAFLKEAAKQCLSASTLPRLGELMRLLSGHVTTDLRAGTVLACGAELLRCDLDAVQTATVQGEGVTVNGVSYYALYDWSVIDIVNDSFLPAGQRLTQEDLDVLTPAMVRRMDG